MNITRRTLLAGAAALPLTAALNSRLVAETRIGTATLTTISDGHLVLPADFIFAPMPADELAPLRAELGLTGDRLTPPCNVTLYRDGTNTVLFDCGSGADFQPTAGALIDNLAAVGVSVEDITHVIFTHAHPDHIWGLLDEFDDPAFPNASYMMGRAEWDYWWDPDTVNTIGTARQAFAAGARRRMEAIEDAVLRFDDGEEILPGIAAVLTPGHTPGHMSFELRQGNDSALVVGDAIANAHIALRRPDWLSGNDQDQPTAAATRTRLVERLAAEAIPLIGFHLPGGGIGRIEPDPAGGYRFVQS